ncbi:MAG TPA: hypothetical protein VF604_10285 [Pyrinomonadaceae bacterium]|jgi:hypothetical protein
MEILILGIILVALMAYVSTRIKKSAAQAFEKETVETEDFSLVKPEGFLSPASGNSEYAFEAYSKDFGENDAAEYRKATVYVRKNPERGENLPDETERTEKGVTIQTFRKILKTNESGEIYELEISVLKDYRGQFFDKIKETLNSFSLKRNNL